MIKALSNHQLNVLAYLLPAVAPVPVARNRLPDARGQSSVGRGQLEGEDEISDEVETWANLHDFLNDVLETDDIASEVLLDLAVGLDLHAFFSCLAKQLLVDEFAHYLLGGFSPGDVVLDFLELPDVGKSASHKDCSIDASQVELAQDDLLLL